MSKFFFKEFFSDAVRWNPYVKAVDIFLINAAGTWSPIDVGKKLIRRSPSASSSP